MILAESSEKQVAAATNDKKMQYRRVQFDVHEIAPDAPAGEWGVSIPRGKCKVQPTQKDKWPMLIVPVRLDTTEEEEDVFTKALGTELAVFITFFGEEMPRPANLTKLRLRELCEAADVDLDLVPKELGDDPESDLQELIRALEGKKFTAWTIIKTRKDTGEENTELRFQNPNKTLSTPNDEEEEEERPQRGAKKKTPAKSTNGSAKRR